jgi:uncharacterized integral membrane protein (TIGR00698 family)
VTQTTMRAPATTRWDWLPAWLRRPYRSLVPGLLFTVVIGVAALLIGAVEKRLFGQEILEPLVLALVIGMLIRTFARIPAQVEPGIAYAAKQVLEFAIVILGATLNLRTIADAGLQLFLCVLIAVPLAICTAIFLGRRLALGTKLAILVAVGNAVCGNSAIAAVAPAIRAKKQEVASAIALTAVLGIGVVLILPPVFHGAVGLNDYRYGILAGMSVYAVPQVLAATLPVSAGSAAVASLVKLTRVLLLGPIVAIFAFLFRNEEGEETKLTFSKLVPWFVTGFLLMSVLRTVGVINTSLSAHAKDVSRDLTILAMAGLGLGVNLKSVRTVGPRVALVVVGSLLLLMAFSLCCIFLLGLNGTA